MSNRENDVGAWGLIILFFIIITFLTFYFDFPGSHNQIIVEGELEDVNENSFILNDNVYDNVVYPNDSFNNPKFSRELEKVSNNGYKEVEEYVNENVKIEMYKYSRDIAGLLFIKEINSN